MTRVDPLSLLADQAVREAALIKACRNVQSAGAKRVIVGSGPLATVADRIAGQVNVSSIWPVSEACRALAHTQFKPAHRGPPARDVLPWVQSQARHLASSSRRVGWCGQASQ